MCFFSAYSLYTDAALGTVTVPSVHRDALSQGMAASTTPCGNWMRMGMVGQGTAVAGVRCSADHYWTADAVLLVKASNTYTGWSEACMHRL